MILQPGETLLDKYRIEELVGKGAFAEVYHAFHLGLEAHRALKVLRRDAPGLGKTEYEDYKDRFTLEARLGASLKHPNIIEVYDFEKSDENLILVMDFVPGRSLADRIQKEKDKGEYIPIPEVLRIALDIAEGLSVLHDEENDIIHRDLKPSNILIGGDGHAIVADLGLAQTKEERVMRSKLSTFGPHPGTPAYKSPEQIRLTDPLDSASDIYALGLVLFDALTSQVDRIKPPWTRTRVLRKDVPIWLDDLIARMLAADPEQRPQNGRNAVVLLQKGMRRKPDGNYPPRPNPWETISKHFKTLKTALAKMVPVFKFIGIMGIIAILLWGGSVAMPWIISFIPAQTATAKTDSTSTPLSGAVTHKPSVTPTKTLTSAPTSMPTEITDSRDIPMRLVPSGEFTMGVNEPNTDIHPAHIVYLDTYYIDKYEVTNSLYAICVDEHICDPPKSDASYTRSNYFGESEFGDYPVIWVDWNKAKTFCEWRGADLPTEAQWEKAARGTEGYTYPWGNTFDGDLVNACDKNCPFERWQNKNNDDGFGDTSPVGYYKGGKSLYGVYDMAGNVWEWVADWYSVFTYENSPRSNPTGPASDPGLNYGYQEGRVLRGGSWYSSNPNGVTRENGRNIGSYINFVDIGFRCAHSAP